MIVDDHAGMRTTIRYLIATPADHVVECASADEALTKLGDFKPDCVTMDVSMPGEVRVSSHARHPRGASAGAHDLRVTSHDQADYRRAALEAGASGFVLKDTLDLYLLVATKRLLSRLQL